MVESGSYDQSLLSFTLDCDCHCLQTPVTGLAGEDGSVSMLPVPHDIIMLVGWKETMVPFHSSSPRQNASLNEQ